MSMTISIITATYNSAKTVRDTFESVLRQSYKDIEYIVVDGASQDETIDIIKAYEPRFDGRMRWVSEPDKGIYDAMNKGLKMATGDVVGILNSDDFYTSNDVLATVAETLADKTIDAVYGDIHYVAETDLAHCVRYYSSAKFSRRRMLSGYMPAHPSFYARRCAYQLAGDFDISFKIGADFENLLRLIYVNRISTRYIAKDFVTMRMGGASSSGIASYWQIMKDHMRAYRKNRVWFNPIGYAWRYVEKLTEFIK